MAYAQRVTDLPLFTFIKSMKFKQNTFIIKHLYKLKIKFTLFTFSHKGVFD